MKLTHILFHFIFLAQVLLAGDGDLDMIAMEKVPARPTPDPPQGEYAPLFMDRESGRAETKRLVRIAIVRDPIEFGGLIRFKAEYRNMGDDVWEMLYPDGSPTVVICLIRVAENAKVHRFGFGLVGNRIVIEEIDGEEVYRITSLPSPRPLRILANSSYRFETVRPRPSLLTTEIIPGRYKVWLEDHSEKLASNIVTANVVMTLGSVEKCLGIAATKEFPVDVRRRHLQWVAIVVPNMDFAWWHPQISEEAREPLEAVLAEKIAEARKYLADPANQEAIASALERINREALEREE